MNNCENNMRVCEGMEAPRETLSELMGKSKAISNESLALAKVIRNHLFGDEKKEVLPKTDPMCFMDAMEEHIDTLKELFEVLHEMIDRLGCQR